jgi:hypothetical protein
MTEDIVFLPRPHSVDWTGTAYSFKAGTGIALTGDPSALMSIAVELKRAVEALGVSALHIASGQPRPHDIELRLEQAGRHESEGYLLVVSEEAIVIEASRPAGIFYGVQTLLQLIEQSGARLSGVRIEDRPSFPSRGVMLDVSRDKVPTLESLYELVDLLASFKINHLELYTEHTFAYRNHPEVWAQASPMTAADVAQLDAYCRDRFVELVPNQNCFGHLNRWLELPRYRQLAECPDGFDTPWGHRASGPFSLNPRHPGSLALVSEWLDELLPNFASKKLNVGCDETWDLGQGASKEECEKRGAGRVYLEFMLKLHELVSARGRTMHFWGDIILQHPELVPELPKDIVALSWGYEANHPFDGEGARFAASGVPFYVCPGTSSWNTFVGRTKNCLGNIENAALQGKKHGAIGLLNTDWGDNGHLQYLPASLLGYAAGAAYAWCPEQAQRIDFAKALSRHAVGDRSEVLGSVLLELGEVHAELGLSSNTSAFFRIMQSAAGSELPEGATAPALERARARLEALRAELRQARPTKLGGSLVVREIENGARMCSHACMRGLARLAGSEADAQVKADLAADLRWILGEHRELWMARNCVGGLQDSPRVLLRCLAEYVSGTRSGSWC